MLTTSISKLRKFAPALFVLIAVAFLSSCNSSNKVASSFGKRKYTKGHFSDPVAKLKMEYKPSNTAVVSMAQPKKVEVKNAPAVQNKATSYQPIANSQVKHPDVAVHSSKSTGIAANNSATTNLKNNVSLNESSVSHNNSNAGYSEHGSASSSSSGMNHYLRMCLLFLALWLILLLLAFIFAAAAVTSGTGAGLGLAGVLYIFSGICFLVSVVFFIVWLIDISK